MTQYTLSIGLKELSRQWGYGFLIVLLIGTISSCNKFVETNPPKTQLVTSTVFKNTATATAAQTAIYLQMQYQNFSYYVPLYTGLSCDELINYSSVQDLKGFYSNGLNAVSNGSIQSLWAAAYSYIYQANAVIENLESSAGVNVAVKQQLTGEAKFIRAFCHFYLVNLYGDVPLVTSTDYNINRMASRTSKAQVYQQIISDLKNAQNLLNDNYVDASDTTITIERVRPNKSAASSMLARVYLYTGDYTNAESQSTAVISNTAMYSLVSDLNNVFLKNSMEMIWQLMPSNVTGYNTVEGKNFILIGPPQTGTANCTAISNQLFSSFETGDNRNKNWIKGITSGTSTYYYPYKYKIAGASTLAEYSAVLRLAEQYLIRSEARAQQGNLNGAISDLNIIRGRAGLTDLALSLNQGQILAAVAQERRVELFAEWGHRWLDLKRTGQVDAVMRVVTPIKGGGWSTNAQLYPIPQAERNNDPNLTQNQGY